VTCFLGIDLGTSAVKALVVDELQSVRASAEARLTVSHPAPLASEQDPDEWWRAVGTALDQIRAEAPAAMAEVAAIGLSGQMHATVLLDAADRPIRPAMLWNDGRAHAEADELKRRACRRTRRAGAVRLHRAETAVADAARAGGDGPHPLAAAAEGLRAAEAYR
jgi:xylulokinase